MTDETYYLALAGVICATILAVVVSVLLFFHFKMVAHLSAGEEQIVVPYHGNEGETIIWRKRESHANVEK